MRHRWTSLPTISSVLLCAALTVAVEAQAQQGKTCCFSNARYSGTCQVSPAPGETCTSILAYLNNANAVGRTYCGNTQVRMGWRQVSCGEGAQPSSAPVTMVVPSAAIMKVRMDESVDLSQKRPGDTFTAHLATDLVADGSLIAPTGAKVYGRLAAVEPEAAAGGPMLELTEIEVDEQRYPVVAGEVRSASDGATAVAVRLDAGAAVLEQGQTVDFGPTVPLIRAGQVSEAIELTRAIIQANRDAIVRSAMELTADEGLRFWPLYREYQAEMIRVNDRTVALITGYAESYPELDDGQAQVMLDEYLDIEAAKLKLRKKYSKRFRGILPDAKVTRFFQIDNKLEAVIRAELAAEIPLVR